jgi:hypothetical protein
MGWPREGFDCCSAKYEGRMTDNIKESDAIAEGVALFLKPYFDAWGDPISKDTGDPEIDGATTSWEMALVASRRLLSLDRSGTSSLT